MRRPAVRAAVDLTLGLDIQSRSGGGVGWQNLSERDDYPIRRASRLTQIVRRGRGSPIRVRRATIIMASASGTPVPAIARLVAADEDTVRDVIHAFNERGLAALDPRWAGGRPRLISDDDIAFIVATATTRPEHARAARSPTGACANSPPTCARSHDRRWSGSAASGCGRSCASTTISFQRTRTWKESTDPDKDAKLDRIEEVTSRFPDAVLRVRPVRAAVDPALPRLHLGARVEADPAAGDLSPHARHPLLPRLLQPRRRPAVGRRSAAARAATTPWPRSSRSGPRARTAPRST